MSHGGDIYRNKVNIDFSVNLNPLPLPDVYAEAINAAMLKGLKDASYYPDIEQTVVRASLTNVDNVDFDCIYAGSGASELIMACVRSVNPASVLLAMPCYTGYMHSIGSLIRSENIAKYYLNAEDGFLLTDGILDHMTKDIDLMFLTDPWNPTGLNIPDGLLETILNRADENDMWVLLDQSFLTLSDKASDCGALNASKLIRGHDRLFIIRSYTKLFALPGIRMGYIISSPDNIAMLRKQLPEWNLSSVAEKTMAVCADIVGNTSYISDSTALIKKERSYLTTELGNLGLTVFDSNTDFILLKSEYNLYSSMLKYGILIRDCSDYDGLGRGYYRISVKDHTSNALFIRAMHECLQ